MTVPNYPQPSPKITGTVPSPLVGDCPNGDSHCPQKNEGTMGTVAHTARLLIVSLTADEIYANRGKLKLGTTPLLVVHNTTEQTT